MGYILTGGAVVVKGRGEGATGSTFLVSEGAPRGVEAALRATHGAGGRSTRVQGPAAGAPRLSRHLVG